MKILEDIWRAVKATRNWYSLAPVVVGLRKQTVLELRNGLRLIYAQRVFSMEHFVEQPYRLVDVEGRDVVDVGAFSGDSAMYFAWKGARRVFAFEPIPLSYRMAIANIGLNRFKNIEMFNEAIGLSEGTLTIDENMVGGMSFRIAGFVNRSCEGKAVRVRAFESLVKDFRLEDAVLKMDCEGCEYEILLNIENELLLPFGQVILEYHRAGPDKLIERLTECGFSVRTLDRTYGRPVQSGARDLGLLYACR